MKRIEQKAALLAIVTAMTVVMFSCDVLHSDPDFKQSAVQVKGNEVYALSSGTTFIDLNARLSVGQPVTITITTQTRSGQLSHLTNSLFKYTPNGAATHDSFSFTAFDQKNNAVASDSIVIILVDSVGLPCGLYPVNDYVTSLYRTQAGYQPTFIPVLANDIICGSDSVNTQLEVYQPDSSYGPFEGVATVSGRGIYYMPSSSFKGGDQFIYKISSKSDPTNYAFGMVHISSTADTCSFSLADDFFGFGRDSVAMAEAGVLLPVFANDVLCHSDTVTSAWQYHIVGTPANGIASVDASGLEYKANVLSVGQSRVDSVRYEVCIGLTCKQALALIVLSK